ncbi:LysR family transcriptional regulator [uncultured Tateyamaria sp.]|uniref:LysR family transcriptional regulator n=1 Tax=uncultured Tateyamaria sp. TaxID=455651 RepID=UPI002612083B|nr:LysR family transcriptional regulator [uncultured Tateyamaria sp.]
MALKTKVYLARTLIAAVEGGSIANGARALNITRSGASKNIAALESALGVKLLNRNARNMSLTEAGETYVQGVKSALDQIESAESAVSQYRAEPSGVLSIESTILFGRLYLAEQVRKYLRAYPKMSVDLRLNDSAPDVTTGEVDLYFRTGRIKHLDMIAIKLMDIYFRTVASPEYIEMFGVPATIASLADHNCLNFRFPSDHSIFQWRHMMESEAVFQNFNGNFISTDVAEIHSAALAGEGIAQLPNQLVDEDIHSGRLVELFPDAAFASNALHMCIPYNRKSDLKVTSFRAFVADHKF